MVSTPWLECKLDPLLNTYLYTICLKTTFKTYNGGFGNFMSSKTLVMVMARNKWSFSTLGFSPEPVLP